ncbi:MAG: nuclear transport factor 2 family protein [Streptomyces sp.]|uniref:nuclear transport factor 2 family protein n=1 Tax=Streptomyces sp. TaxID=1931 RepID=UPI003D6B1B0D
MAGTSPEDQEPDAAASQVAAIVADWAAAIVSNDAARIAAFMADEWVMVSESGVTSKERFLSFVESGDLTHSAMDLINRARVKVYGDTAVFTGRVTNTAHYRDQRFDADEWTTDVFVKRDGRWLCVLSQITAASAEG